MKKYARISLTFALALATLVLAACESSSFSLVTNDDNTISVESENADEQSGMGYVQVGEGQALEFDVDISDESKETAMYVVKIYVTEEATGEEDIEEIAPDEDGLIREITFENSEVLAEELEPGDYTIVVDGSGGVTGTLNITVTDAAK